MSKAEQEGTFNDILKLLDKHFQYDDRVALPNDFDSYFQLLRKPGQTLLNFVTEHDELHRRLERHSVALPNKVQGWHLLRRSGLTRDQRQMVMLKAPLLDKKDVIEALYLLFGQDQKGTNSGDRPRYHHRGKGGKGRGYFVDEEGYYYDDDDEDESYDPVDDTGYYEAYDEAATQYEDWPDDESFDHDAGYYNDEEIAGDFGETPFPVDSYDEAYAAYVDARKRFSDLRLSRGFLPVVALSDPSAGNLSPGISSPGGSPSHFKGKKGGKGKGYGGGKSGKGKNLFKYNKPPPKPHETRARGKALTCLRCGRPGHFAAECPIPKGSSASSPTSTKRPASSIEAMAKFEDAHVTFVDSTGQERHDVTLLDPGASAFLCGFGPLARYLNYLKVHGFPVHEIEFNRCCRRFQFGGDGSSWSHWVVRLPLCISGVLGRAQVFLVKGETPLLCGRPIIEALGIDLAFSRQAIRYRDGPWMSATLGLQGEYLLPLWEPSEDLDFSNLDFQFDLIVASEGEVDPNPCSMQQFEQEEYALVVDACPADKSGRADGERPLLPKQLQTFDTLLLEMQNDLHAYVTSELHSQPSRVIWEVYCGNARTSQLAETFGARVETFSYETGWDFDLKSHREAFLSRLQAEVPDDLLLAPTCGPWSPMQNLAARSEEQKMALQELREWHHEIHLNFVRKAYLIQVRNGAHAHLEQPMHALSWKTRALRRLPGFMTLLDQCQFGSQCLDSDGLWKLVKKPTAILTTKRFLHREMSRRCDGGHQHCPLEGTAPGIGRRTQYLEDYQPGLAAVLSACLLFDEPPSITDFVGAVNEDKEQMTGIVQLLTENKAEAVRTVQRLHRNLGHPDNKKLTEMLASRNASQMVLDVASKYHCVACKRYHKPNAPSPAQVSTSTVFNETLQADVFWIKLGEKKFPILSMVDVATKFQAASVIYGERTQDFLHALERGWIRHFGCPQVLVTDEGRGWASDEMLNWTSSMNLKHVMAPGEAHTRLSLVERRHAVLRKAIEIYLTDLNLTTVDGIRQALAYVLPQINSSPTVAGFSPAQWVLGYQPNFPGDLTAEGLSPAQLGGTPNFELTLERRSVAKQALTKADADRRLRRALLRRYAGQNVMLQPGQDCYYWRDARQADLVKIRWLGPAKVVLREDDEAGKPNVYWISHGTQLLRCAPHHVRPDFRTSETTLGGLEEARQAILSLKSRGVTRFLDLNRINKRNIDEVDEDEEAMDDGSDEPALRRPRLDIGGSPRDASDYTPSFRPDEPPADLELPEVQLPTSQYSNLPLQDQLLDPDSTELPSPQELPSTSLEPPPAIQELPGVGTEHEGSQVDGLDFLDQLDADEPEPGVEPSAPPSARSRSTRATAEVPTLDPATAALYEPAPAEDFFTRRSRVDRQETLMYGPRRQVRPLQPSVEPYSLQPPGNLPSNEDKEMFSQAFTVSEMESNALPSGWTFDEAGYLQLAHRPSDFWAVRSGCLIRHHVHPRHNLFNYVKDKDAPIDKNLLDPVRVTLMKLADGQFEIANDTGDPTRACRTSWTGCTVFQINGKTRKELCMYSNLPARKLVRDERTKMVRQQKKVDKGGVSERHLSLEQKLLFQAAKQKELQSFFENQVWEFDKASSADPARTMTARMLLKWSKNEDGSPRAKARLIVRGYSDVDALQGTLETSSPTTTRLSRNFLLSLSTILQWQLWTSDIATAFLQGLPQERKLWVKLPAECLKLLDAEDDTRMLLVKPVYGQLDAPRRWYLEAVRRLRALGLRQHILDPCTFLIYEADHGGPTGESPDPDPSFLGSERLCGMICLHVDDMLGAGDPNSEVYNKVLAELRKSFSFREWKDGSNLEYCGANIDKLSDGTIKLHHGGYLRKIKPMTISKHLGPESELNSKETTTLRGLLGAIQWPAVQSSPHLQASTSILSGSISRGLVKTALEANKLLKFAKENDDVGLTFAPLRLSEVCLVTAFDASFGCRPDGTSQGGFLVMLAPRRILETEEDFYHILDWKSQKLPRVARSSLAAEAQAAACAADSTEFVCRYFEHLKKPNLTLAELLKEKSTLRPTLVTDAKALYDSYHRESLVSSVTDRRISLEIRVVKEQLQSLSGNLRWVSSERQLADGLTKESTRQSLSDRLRHARIKFLWDPDYVAAKKKPLAERNKNLQESSQSRNSKKKKKHPVPSKENETLRVVDENFPETFDVAPNDIAPEENYVTQNDNVVENDLMPAETFVPENDFGGTYFAKSDDVKYKVSSSFGKKLTVALMCCLPTPGQGYGGNPMSSTSSGGGMDFASFIPWMLLLGLVGYLLRQRRDQRLRGQELSMRLVEADRTACTFAIVVPKLSEDLERANDRIRRLQAAYEEATDNYDRLAQAYQDAIDGGGGHTPVGFRTAFTELNELRGLRDDSIRIVNRAIQEIEHHMDHECPHHMDVYVTNEHPTWWHTNIMCPGIVHNATVQHVRACQHEHCAERWTTPWIPDASGESLLTQMESYLEDARYAAEFQR